MSWFRTRELCRGVWMLAEPLHVNSWMVGGGERAVLLDTGCGIAPIRPVAESLTSLPLSVVNTHYHSDHTGGNHEFDEIVTHELTAPLIELPVLRESLDGFLEHVRRLEDAARRYREIDREFFHLLDVYTDPLPFPDDFDPAAWSIVPTSATGTVVDGDRIELGGRALTVLHTPGHSPDGISLLDERNGILFPGDMVQTGPMYAQFEDSDLADFAASTRRLAELRDDIWVVAVHHWGRWTADPGFLVDVADGVELVAAGEARLERSVDVLRNPVLEAYFDRFSLCVPDPDAAPLTLTPGDAATAGA